MIKRRQVPLENRKYRQVSRSCHSQPIQQTGQTETALPPCKYCKFVCFQLNTWLVLAVDVSEMPPQIQQKMRIKAKKPWKKVKVEDHFLNQEVPEDFLGIEELTDYKLVKKTKKAVVVTKAVKKSKAKKKKAAGKIVEKNGIKNKRKNDDSESEDAEVSSEEPASKRVKVKKHDVESDKEIDEVCKKSRLKLYVSLILFCFVVLCRQKKQHQIVLW